MENQKLEIVKEIKKSISDLSNIGDLYINTNYKSENGELTYYGRCLKECLDSKVNSLIRNIAYLSEIDFFDFISIKNPNNIKTEQIKMNLKGIL